MNYIIQIKVEETVTGYVGPFLNEDAADTYCKLSLEPKMPGAKFYISDVIDPSEFLVLLVNTAQRAKPLTYFEEKYGTDFRAKLPLYKTAYLGGQIVRILRVNMARLELLVVGTDQRQICCNVRELDNFVL
jgi:hypothetical protein